ncbi:AraC family transcriptional regulator ligand-binding domain-containing protein [Nocardia sp. CDC159]|uniref:AraC family transcriptional regulator ligand-binding domain-containing protein n=1 Tax=Nocardia pulmonis TaxID=2951408 RepID=A0A9X2E8U0_9NOCA|nr:MULTISPECIES: AraC family transcriptional regulator [Nocardia]MCM6776427.1 AraC family transcriptional regulator ligand-binding domain-containing protein [Nocardia pulmonis]MCM6788851.1 AraC family transcriptional regulator ligand-binding domain-containing protein [Nocardia sp. CDC159]
MDDDRATDEPLRLRSTNGAALLADFAESRGVPMPDILRGTGITESQLRDPTAEMTLEQEITLTRNVVRGVHDEPGLGLMAGLLCHAPNFGVLGFAIMSCATLRQAAEVGLRYADLASTLGRHWMEDRGDEVWILRDDRFVPEDLRRFVLERDVAAVGTVQQDVLPMRVPTMRVELALPAHPIYEMFGTLLGVDSIVFDAERSCMVWQASTLDMPLPQANPATQRYYEQQCADLIQRRRGRAGISGRVRQLLIRRGGLADQTRIAADLDVSVRTLRRRLADEGTTFRELSTETVGMLAEELLLAGLTVEHVADRLGYSSVSAFTSAFRSWKGQSPGQFARANRGRVTVRV